MLFAAHLPRETVLPVLAEELAAELRAQGRAVPAGLRVAVDAGLESAWDEVRRQGVSRTHGGAVPGVSAMAAPVFDDAGRIVLMPHGHRPLGHLRYAMGRCGERYAQTQRARTVATAEKV